MIRDRNMGALTLALIHLISFLWTRQNAVAAEQKFQPPLMKVPQAKSITSNTNGRYLRSNASPLRIRFHTEPLESALVNADEKTIMTGRAIIDQVLPTITDLWYQTLSVVPSDNIVVPNDVCFGLYDFPSSWSDASKGLEGTDLLVFVSAFSSINNEDICDRISTSSSLAVSAPCAIDPSNDRPVVGFANLCLESLSFSEGLIDESIIKSIVDVLSHELVHILGINSDMFKYYRNSVTGKPLTSRKKGFLGIGGGGFKSTTVKCVDDKPDEELFMPCSNTIQYREEEVKYSGSLEMRSYYEIVLPTVLQVARNQFNCQSLTGVRLENQPTADDCIGSHFDERQWFTEFMSTMYDKDTAFFSSLTLAMLEDSGWYSVNYHMAENSPFGLGAGCDFVEKECIVDGSVSDNRSIDVDVRGIVPEYGKGYFCNDIGGDDWGCGPSHNFRGKCDLMEYAYPPRSYFDPSHIGPKFPHADFCPLIISDAVDCNDKNATKLFPVEKFSPNSNCVNVNVAGAKSAMCLAGFCNQLTHSYTIQVGTKVLSCTKDFEVKLATIDGITYRIECPRLTQVCPK